MAHLINDALPQSGRRLGRFGQESPAFLELQSLYSAGGTLLEVRIDLSAPGFVDRAQHVRAETLLKDLMTAGHASCPSPHGLDRQALLADGLERFF